MIYLRQLDVIKAQYCFHNILFFNISFRYVFIKIFGDIVFIIDQLYSLMINNPSVFVII